MTAVKVLHETSANLVPFDIHRPVNLATPFVCASPHSGRLYPPDMLAASVLDISSIRRSEDAFVDQLAGTAPDHGLPLISARYARAYVDVNREAYELDQAMFEDELPAFARARTARVAAGLGAIARVVAEGQEIYASKLTFAHARDRIERVHIPYHAALASLIAEAKAAFGLALLIDWHSMPSAAAEAVAGRGRAADFVLGDRFGSACAPGITRLAQSALEDMGYAVALNTPYAGGYTTEFYGKPKDQVHALQIEINRGLYLDERRLEPHRGFDRLRTDLDRLFAKLAAVDLVEQLGLAQPTPSR